MFEEDQDDTLTHVTHVIAPMLAELMTQVRVQTQTQQTQTIGDTELFGVPVEQAIEPPGAEDLGAEIEPPDVDGLADTPAPEAPSPQEPIEAVGFTPSTEQPLPFPDADALGEGAALFDESIGGLVLDPPPGIEPPEPPDAPPVDRGRDPSFFSDGDPDGTRRHAEQTTDDQQYRLEPTLADMSDAQDSVNHNIERRDEQTIQFLQKLADRVERHRHRLEELESAFERGY